MSTDKVAIITAGGSGMGAAAARKLAADGYRVAILSSSGKGEALAAELGGLGVTGSNRSPEDLARLVDATLQQWGRVDAVVNSAGHGPKGPLLEISDDDWHLGMEFYLLNYFKPGFHPWDHDNRARLAGIDGLVEEIEQTQRGY